MEHKHTPGPWRTAGRMTNGAALIRGSEATSEVAVVLQNDTRYSVESNARLIAAAPDLLQSCRGMLHALETDCRDTAKWDELMTEALAAIAKATRGQA